MNLPHRIEIIEPKKMAGFSIITSFQEDNTSLLWRKFMPKRNEIPNRISKQLFSLQIYPQNFTPDQSFTKWALAEVSDFENIQQVFEHFELESGKYIVFSYKGKAENGPEIFRFIFQDFIPRNGFEVDSRPHFELFGENYNPADDAAQEEIWIPVK